jgi:hypothetical protein
MIEELKGSGSSSASLSVAESHWYDSLLGATPYASRYTIILSIIDNYNMFIHSCAIIVIWYDLDHHKVQ